MADQSSPDRAEAQIDRFGAASDMAILKLLARVERDHL
jgi:hypothetical protein